VTRERDPLEDAAEDLFEDAPCGHVSTRLDGTIVRVNRTLEAWIGLARAELLGSTALPGSPVARRADLLARSSTRS